VHLGLGFQKCKARATARPAPRQSAPSVAAGTSHFPAIVRLAPPAPQRAPRAVWQLALLRDTTTLLHGSPVLARRRAAARAEPLGPTIGRGGRMSVPTPPVSLPRGTGQRRTAPIPPFSGAETPPPLPGVRCRPAAGRGRRSAAGRGGSGSRCPDARNGREHRRSYRRLRIWWCVSASTACGAGSRPAGPISTAGGRVRRQDLGCWGRRPATATGSCTPPRSRTRCGAAKLKLGFSTVVVFVVAGPVSPCTMISCICTDRASVYFVSCVCVVCACVCLCLRVQRLCLSV